MIVKGTSFFYCFFFFTYRFLRREYEYVTDAVYPVTTAMVIEHMKKENPSGKVNKQVVVQALLKLNEKQGPVKSIQKQLIDGLVTSKRATYYLSVQKKQH